MRKLARLCLCLLLGGCAPLAKGPGAEAGAAGRAPTPASAISDAEIADLSYVIVVINSWNLLNVSLRNPVPEQA